MKKWYLFSLIGIFFLFLSMPVLAQEEDENTTSDEPTEENSGIGGSAFVGGVTIDGKNYQQFGIRTDIPIFKLGLGVDIQLLLDDQGQVRREDWDEWQDYLDKLYYIRWGHKDDPFYFKFGGIDFTNIGYGNIVNGYSNMVQYPDIKRWGLEMSVQTRKFGAQLLINNFKELFASQPGMLAAGRVSYRVVGKLEVGATYATDLNEYNGLLDFDKDGYPDEIDAYPRDPNLVTDYDYYLQKSNDQNFVDMAVQYGLIDGTKKSDLIKYGDLSKTSFAYGFDIGYPIIEGDNLNMSIYSAFTQLGGDSLYGWGASLPGIKLQLGKLLTFKAEYRKASDHFLFGYYNYTYELERAIFVTNPTTNKKEVVSKQMTLADVNQATNGFFAGIDLNLADMVIGQLHYSDLVGDSANLHIRSLKGEIELTPKLLPKDARAKGYYIQNNVQDFRQWKTPSTIMGYTLEYNFNGVNLGFDYRFTFQDLDGSGKIDQPNETIKTFGLKTAIKF